MKSKKTLVIGIILFIFGLAGFETDIVLALLFVLGGVALIVLYAYKSKPKYKKPVIPVSEPPFVSPYELITVKVKGVTFTNEDNKSRQTLLKNIKAGISNTGREPITTLKEYQYEGQPAYGVYVGKEQIGNVPADKVFEIKSMFDRYDKVSAIEVYGGGRNEYGETNNYGAKITIRFFKQELPIS